jgi:tRNA threonylcarbamoyladenosine biosynthesis protein TsaB
MSSLTSLVRAHSTVLLVDSASALVQVGLWRHEEPVRWRQSALEPSVAVFASVNGVLDEAGIGLAEIGALLFCEGPGSILGIRTTAMALRAWQTRPGSPLPAFAYRSLDLVAHDLCGVSAPTPLAVIADARRDRWHFAEVGSDRKVRPLQRVSGALLAAFNGPLFMPTGFRAWAQLARPVSAVPYALPDLWHRQRDCDLLQPSPTPDAFLHEDPIYLTWSPQIHRAPAKAAP